MKKKIFYWALYDFANSLVFISFVFYFSQWLVIDQGKPAWWYNATLIISSLLFLSSAPYLSKKVDQTKEKIKCLRIWSIVTFLGFLSVSMVTVLSSDNELAAAALFTLSSYAYLTCFLYFTPILNDISTTENRSSISGIAAGANSFGWLVGLMIVLPFVNGLTLLGEPGRAQAFLPATILFGLFALPLLIFYKEDKLELNHAPNTETSVIKMFRTVFSNKPLALLFLAYFLFSDALITFANNFPLYLEVVHHVSDTMKSILSASIFVFASIGAIIFGKIADKKGNLNVLKKIIIVWVFLFIIMASVTSLKLLVPVFLFAGILYGPVWAISRSMVGQISKEENMASSYSYYVVAERFATFIGPLIWSICLITAGEGVKGYQTALIAVGIIMALSLIPLSRIKKYQQI